ncbi:MAG: hypothetical protein EOP06_03800 [Proteobacteria bacterium]|nr:MAG: hypothetical protein EOP06_03800 [Pseudomonadota bacterium]
MGGAPGFFFEYKGIEVYHCYRHDPAGDDMDLGRKLFYQYTTADDRDPEGNYAFDIRSLPHIDGLEQDDVDCHEEIISIMIDSRKIPYPK